MKGVALKYFRLFSEKNIDALSHLFDEEASLRDWQVEAQDRVNVLTAMRETFDSVESIQVNVVDIHELRYEKKIIAELEIVIDGNTEESLSVVDIIKFSDEEKILSIKAFKG
jgi:hypothetical protein|tara:strand:+ start:17 stop:352 length:336 start_codon:yes stop_codon:yes gene_type:complete